MPKTGRKKRVEARFKPDDRVAWTSGSEWKSGTIISMGLSKEEALKSVPPGYTMAYKSAKPTKGRLYLVAADFGMLKPGYHLHSVKESRLRHEHESWMYRLDHLETLSKPQLLDLSTQILKYVHDRGKKSPKEIRGILEKFLPTTF